MRGQEGGAGEGRSGIVLSARRRTLEVESEARFGGPVERARSPSGPNEFYLGPVSQTCSSWAPGDSDSHNCTDKITLILNIDVTLETNPYLCPQATW